MKKKNSVESIFDFDNDLSNNSIICVDPTSNGRIYYLHTNKGLLSEEIFKFIENNWTKIKNEYINILSNIN